MPVNLLSIFSTFKFLTLLVEGGSDAELLILKSTLYLRLRGLLPLQSFLAVCLEGLATVMEELLHLLTLISETMTSLAISPVPRSLSWGATIVRRAGTVEEVNAACWPIIERLTLWLYLRAMRVIFCVDSLVCIKSKYSKK